MGKLSVLATILQVEEFDGLSPVFHDLHQFERRQLGKCSPDEDDLYAVVFNQQQLQRPRNTVIQVHTFALHGEVDAGWEMKIHRPLA